VEREKAALFNRFQSEAIANELSILSQKLEETKLKEKGNMNLFIAGLATVAAVSLGFAIIPALGIGGLAWAIGEK